MKTNSEINLYTLNALCEIILKMAKYDHKNYLAYAENYLQSDPGKVWNIALKLKKLNQDSWDYNVYWL